MRVLLDTHILIWLARFPERLNRFERGVLAEEDASLFVSAVSVWEIRIKWQQRDREGRRKGEISPAVALAHIESNDLELIALSAADCVPALSPAIGHRDPFDEMLLLHAQAHGARLLTRDRPLIGHPLAIRPA